MTAPVCDSPGFSEAVVSVRDINAWIDFLEGVFQWSVVYRGAADDSLRAFWRLPQTVAIEEALLREPNAETGSGAIRLVQFKNIEQRQARPNAYAWDTGGFFDLHVQVRDVHGLFANMERAGWIGYTPPQRLSVSGVVLDEVLIRGPDGMAFALIERISPPFNVVEGYERVSPAWNAPQMVSDFAAAHRFYADGLGFKPTIETEMAPDPNGENLYGLPLSVAKTTSTQLAFFHPTGVRGAIGSVDILHLVGLEGRQLTNQAHPPNLGLIVLRFPVRNIEEYEAAVQQAGVDIASPLTDVKFLPEGSAQAFSVVSPEGARLEFYEAGDP